MPALWKALKHSLSGLREAVQTERAVRQEILLCCLLVPLIFILPLSSLLRLILLVSHLAVLIVELLNSAIEAVVDIASPQIHPLAKKAKNFGSAAVMLSLINLVIVWLFTVKELLF